MKSLFVPDRAKLILQSLLLGALTTFAAAPSLRAQRMTLADGEAVPVVIETANVSTEVTGLYAVTTLDLVFRNPNTRALEGTFEFPLLDGQKVIRYALDIGGTLREAVPVEKEKGRATFEEIARRGVDPALLEQTAGNNYRARVFPLPARGTRRIVIAYQEALRSETEGPTKYRLPLALGAKVAHFGLTLAVHSGGTTPTQVRTTLPLDLPAWDADRVLRVSRDEFAAQGMIELTLPWTEAETLTTERLNGREYFSAEVPLPDLPKVLRPTPKVIGLIWDASGSGRNRDHALQFAFLDAWFGAVPEVEVRLVRMRDTAEPATTFRIERGDWTELRGALENSVYDGATSLDGIGCDASVAEWLMFSDGVFNYGTTKQAKALQRLGVPVHAIAAAAGSDTTVLRGLCERSGGRLVDLLALAPAEAVRQVRERPLRLWRVEHDSAAVAHVFPEPGSEIARNRLEVVGILRKREATLRLRIGTSESEAREVVVDLRSGTGAGTLAARAWAGAKINALSVEPERNRGDIRRTAQDFGIVTADTSLIVLETAADYAIFDIEPPAELRREWKRLRRAQADSIGKERRSHLDAVAEDFAERVAWWETSPKNGARHAQRDPGRSHRAGELTGSRAERVAPTASGGAGRTQAETGENEEFVVLSPFVVESESSEGYRATETLAGSRVRTELQDVASSISVVRRQLLRDAGASNDRDLLIYTTNTETAGVAGNFGRGGRPGRAGAKPNREVAGSRPAFADGGAAIALKPWSPDAGYIDHLRRVPSEARYGVYLQEKADHEADVGFFVDVGGFFLEQGETALGLRILSNLAELALEDAALLRILGHRLVQAKRAELAVPLFERVLRLRGEEPQSRRDLALACAATRQHQRAVDLLWEIVARPWHDRFPGIELLALGELNEIAATCGEKLDLSQIDQRLRRALPVGLRVVLTWDADNCDIDLWVDDPDGERAYYGNRHTARGGIVSCDFTGGYGPEEFMLRKPKDGRYTVHINYFGDRRTTALAPVTAQLRLITGYGTRDQKEEQITVRLDSESKTLEVGCINLGKGTAK